MTKTRALSWMVIILLGAFFLRQYRLLDFPYHGDEVDEGDIALEILHGHLAPFYPQNEGNEPLYQFTLAPFFPVLGDTVIANRFPSAAWSLVFVALMYAYARELFSSRRAGALSAGLAAALWWPTVFGRLGLREISQPVMMTPALIALVTVLRDASTARARRAAFIGAIFAGLTSYTFPAGRGFPILVLVFLLYAAIVHRPQLRERWRDLGIYFALMIVINIPLWIFLMQNSAQDFHVGDLTQRSWLIQGDWAQAFPNLRDTAGMFTWRGDLNWVRNIPGRPVFPGIEGWIFYGGIALCLRRWRKPEYALQLIVLAVMLAPNVLAEDPPRWTRGIGILPGLIAVTVAPVEYAWARLNNRQTRIAFGALIAFLGLSIYARTAFDMFTNWIDQPGVYWMTLAYYDSAGKYIHQSSDTTPVNYVMDVYSDWRKHNVTRVAARSDIEMRFSLTNALVFPRNELGDRLAFQNLAAPPSSLLAPIANSGRLIFVDPRTDPGGNRPLQIYFVPRNQLEVQIARARLGAVFLPDSGIRVNSFNVSDLLEFDGYQILDATAKLGQALNVLTYWRVLRTPPDLAIFVHLLDPGGNIVAQYDGFDVVTQDLKPDDLVMQLHALELPPNFPRATYRFEIGAYTRSDGKRIPLAPGGDHLWLQNWDFSPTSP